MGDINTELMNSIKTLYGNADKNNSFLIKDRLVNSVRNEIIEKMIEKNFSMLDIDMNIDFSIFIFQLDNDVYIKG